MIKGLFSFCGSVFWRYIYESIGGIFPVDAKEDFSEHVNQKLTYEIESE